MTSEASMRKPFSVREYSHCRKDIGGRAVLVRCVAALTLLLASALNVAPMWADDAAKTAPVTKFVGKENARSQYLRLWHRLLPSFLDLKPGNAAIVYTKISVEFNSPRSEQARDLDQKIADWQEEPVEKLPRAEVDAALALHAERLKEAGTRRRGWRRADWQLPARGDKPWAIMLPEVQGIRWIARLLMLRVRLAIADGRFDDSSSLTCKPVFAMARHVGQGPTLVQCSWWGSRFRGSPFKGSSEGLMRAPNAPNLYWAIMGLPRPWIDLRPGMDAESHFIDFSFPKLQDVDTATYSADQWRAKQLVAVAATAWQVCLKCPLPPRRLPEYMATAFAIKAYPRGKQLLIAAGSPAAEVEKLPVAEVALRGMMHDYRRVRDENFKWWYVPYAQRGDGPRRAADETRRAEAHLEGYPFVNLLSAVSAVSLGASP